MATWAQIEKRIMARLDAIEARMEDLARQAEDIKGIGDVVDEIKRDLGYIPTDHNCCAGEAAFLLDELAEDARRRERLQWLAEARAAMGRAS